MKDKKIVQKWACKTKGWPDGHWSKVSFSLRKTRTGTKLTLVHRSIPDVAYKNIKMGWTKYYWKPMKKMLEK